MSDGPADEGRQEPRLATPLTPGLDSYGPLVAKWADEHLSRTLFDWQLIALTRQLTHVDHHLVHRDALTSVARQNGKTDGGADPLIGWWLTDMPKIRGGRPQGVLSMSHKLSLAEESFEALLPILVEYGAKAYLSSGRKRLFMPDGSEWNVHAATRGAGHGTTNDLVVVDEVWDVDAKVIDTGLRPTMRTRQMPYGALLSCWSTAGDENSTFMKRMREQGLTLVESAEPGRLCLSEWSPPPNVDPMDERFWRYSNPSLGHLIDLETIRDEARQPDKQQFMRTSLNLWVSADKAWMEAARWEVLKASFPPLEGGVLVVDASTDGTSWVGVRCAMVEGVACVEVAFVTDRESEAWDETEAVMKDRQVKLAVGAALDVHMPRGLEKRAETVGQAELGRWTKLVRSMIVTERRVVHRGDIRLDEHVRRAVGVRTSGENYTLSSVKSPGPIELARCLVFAVALAASPEKPKRRAAVGGATKR